MLTIDAPIKTNDHGCIVGETLIHTTNGYIPIKDLVGTEGSIETINPITKEKCIKRYFNVCKTQENAEIIKLEFKNGEIIQLTSNHPVLTDRGWVEVENLTLKDNVVTLDGFMNIKSIYICGNQDVYNMAVEDVNCYAVTNSDIILHNCDALRYGIMYMKDKHKVENMTRNIGW